MGDTDIAILSVDDTPVLNQNSQRIV